ncbi:MAG: asparagine synthase (glutamine-hydrolyzing) [Ulvibacter sp.]|jgi:asparagine synthase (glutamine-hydrolysing)
MPGIIGCSVRTGTVDEILLAREEMTYNESYKKDTVFQDGNIICTRTHLNIIGELSSPFEADGLFCWVEGEMYNIKELKDTFTLSGSSAAQIIVEAFKMHKLEEVLAQIDGFYVAVLYDKKSKQVHFISSRYGFKPLYIWQENDRIAWSAEQKGFLQLKSFPKKIDKNSLQCFMQLGHLMGTATWFENVKQVDASSWLTYSLEDLKVVSNIRYWSWSKVKVQKISFEDAVVQGGKLFKSAVAKQCLDNKNYLIALSGGLDSRAIFAAIPEEVKVEAFTFGVKNCEDIQYAQKVTANRPARHKAYILNDQNWFKGRAEAVWRSEGMISFAHYHATQFEPDIGKKGQISFNGFAGEVVLGSYWMKNLNSPTTLSRAQKEFGEFVEMDRPENPFYQIGKEAPYCLNARVRKFTAHGLNEIKEFENRIPFFDNQLIEFIYSIPDEYRQENKLYNQLLLNEFPKYFKTIPRQGSGVVISNEKGWAYYSRRIPRILLQKIGVDRRDFATYDKWLKTDQELFKKVLLSEQAIFSQFLEEDFKKEIGKFENIELIGRLFTIEVWLQQIFNQRFLSTEELTRFAK